MSDLPPEGRDERSLNRRQRAELQALRDNQQRLIAFDGGAEILSWVTAHRHHKDEPYIGCLFCRDGFVPKARLDAAVEALRVIADGRWNKTGEWKTRALTAPEFARSALAGVIEAEPGDCTHEWTDARNQVVLSGEWCPKCGAIRAGNVEAEPDHTDGRREG